MKNCFFLILAVVVCLLCSCGMTQPLYYWGDKCVNGTTEYENATYKSYKKQTPEALCVMLCTYEKMVKNPGGLRMVPPPGICAEYAYYLSLPETKDVWTSTATTSQKRILTRTDFDAYAAELFELEIKNYPESALFIKPLMEKLLQR